MAGEHPGEQAIFESARQIQNGAEREVFLAKACGDDVALRDRVSELLGALNDSANFLESPPTAVASAVQTARQEAPEPPKLSFLLPPVDPRSLGRLDHYHILEIVGSGGFGVVLKARDEKLQRIVAVKTLAESLAASGAARQRFVREAQAAAAVRHDNVVSIYAVDDAGSVPYLVMEFVDGVSLEDKLRRDGALPLKEILRIGLQLAEGLDAAHKQGLVHRDVKPANILLENGVQRVKITDFGLARAADDASLTATGLIAGTPAYMSPEQARGDTIDYRSDLFSLGSVLYAICTGQSPFRGSTTFGVIKRVCEEQPRPIRDLNPDIPDWLSAIIARLHAKDRAERYQSAAEVAELLSQHLGQLQHPNTTIGTVSQSAIRNPQSAIGRPWAIAAAALVFLLLGISLTEATGVTRVVPTVIRIVTGEGTLVVETDPDVQVSVEGNGDLTFQLAGGQSIRVPTGDYRVKATKEGQPIPLDKELVSIARGGNQVVRVRLERAPHIAAAPSSEQGAFVLLAAGKERKFETLAEAVASTSNGDTIEIRGNGPFICGPVKLTHALTIRAAEGSRPVLLFAENLRTDAPLVLEGLELQRVGQKVPQGDHEAMVLAWGSPSLHIVNCRFREHLMLPCVGSNAPIFVLRNCEFLCPLHRAVCLGGKQCVIDNCLAAGWGMLQTGFDVRPDQPEISVQITRSTLRSSEHTLLVQLSQIQPNQLLDEDAPRVRVDASEAIFDAPLVVVMNEVEPFLVRLRPQPEDAKALLLRMIAWRDRDNLYVPGGNLLLWNQPPEGVPREIGPRSLADWKRLWVSGDGDAVEGIVKYQGGDLLAKLRAAPETLTPDDFRLRPDSAGYRAGLDGKDLGADVDLVGPGAAYDRWKKTPEYQQWRKDTGQSRTDSPKPESQAFAVLTGKGAEVRKFDTLAEAVQGASDGDTIEIRGNGPFGTHPIQISNRALTIRAAAGFRPIVRWTRDESDKGLSLLKTNSDLVLEGLELQWDAAGAHKRGVAIEPGPALHVANCRFHLPDGFLNIWDEGVTKKCQVRNCEFLSAGATAIGGNNSSGFRGEIANCILRGTVFDLHPRSDELTLRITRSTTVGARVLHLVMHQWPPKSEPVRKLISIETADNVFAFSRLVATHQYESHYVDGKPLPSKELETLLRGAVSWHDKQNLHSITTDAKADSTQFQFHASAQTGDAWLHGPTDLASWSKFWGSEETGSVVGKLSFQGGDLNALTSADAAKLPPADFRLRPDSAGYRAGPDGKDLGADVDLVGPGAAYERWKQTPEYEQWLKDTGQLENRAAAKPETGAFVLLGGPGIAERKFDTLAEAVQAASDGDTIEIRGNGPFETDGVEVHGRALVIRAAPGCQPVLSLSATGRDKNRPIILAHSAALALEGLTFQRIGSSPTEALALILTEISPLRVANCRFVVKHNNAVAIWNNLSPMVDVRNCVFVGSRDAVLWANPKEGTLSVDNCLLATWGGVGFNHADQVQRVDVRLTHNTFAGGIAVTFAIHAVPDFFTAASKPEAKRFRVEAENNVFAVTECTFYAQPVAQAWREKPVPAGRFKTLVADLVGWRDRRNLYPSAVPFLTTKRLLPTGGWGPFEPLVGSDKLDEWREFAGPEAGALRGKEVFAGGDTWPQAAATPEWLLPKHFGLLPQSPGYRAGPDGKDLGADVDLVGPGAAYERWKQTPEYQEWLKETGQEK